MPILISICDSYDTPSRVMCLSIGSQDGRRTKLNLTTHEVRCDKKMLVSHEWCRSGGNPYSYILFCFYTRHKQAVISKL